MTASDRPLEIVYVAAGAAGMYCGSCLHDNTLAAALLDEGQNVLLVPTYTPTRTDEQNLSQERVFFGGINVYLQQKLGLFRHTPWWLDRLLDRPGLLNWAGRRGVSTRPEDLGDLTVSMLQGESGHQAKEVRKLVHWLGEDPQVDVLHLSNSMLMGMAPAIQRELGIPIVCTLSGEDIFLEKLPEPYYSKARDWLRRDAEAVSAFVALNSYFADFMAEYLAVGRERVHVIPHGMTLEGHHPRQPVADAPRTIGYFARICEDKGLHLLVEAFAILAADRQFDDVRLRTAGYLGEGDRDYFNRVVRAAAAHGLGNRFEYAGELDRDEKIAFFHSLDMMSVPTIYRESKGISILEALANAVPVVLPAHGTFPEIVQDTGGGVLCNPHDADSLAGALAHLLTDLDRARELGQAGHAAIHDRYHRTGMAQRTLQLYHQVLADQRESADRTGATIS